MVVLGSGYRCLPYSCQCLFTRKRSSSIHSALRQGRASRSGCVAAFRAPSNSAHKNTTHCAKMDCFRSLLFRKRGFLIAAMTIDMLRRSSNMLRVFAVPYTPPPSKKHKHSAQEYERCPVRTHRTTRKAEMATRGEGTHVTKKWWLRCNKITNVVVTQYVGHWNALL